MKKILFGLLAVLLVLPIGVNAKEKVKVYMFTKDGCGYCEAQKEYLQGLEGYNKTFEVVENEIYDSNWGTKGEYDLAVKVAEAFEAKGYGADMVAQGYHMYQSTPFIVVSNLYAKSAYNTSLETVINQVYEEGDKDIVGCIKDGKKDCEKDIVKVEGTTTTDTEEDTTTKGLDNAGNVIAVTLISAVVLVAVYLVKSTLDTNKVIDAINNKKK